MSSEQEFDETATSFGSIVSRESDNEENSEKNIVSSKSTDEKTDNSSDHENPSDRSDDENEFERNIDSDVDEMTSTAQIEEWDEPMDEPDVIRRECVICGYLNYNSYRLNLLKCNRCQLYYCCTHAFSDMWLESQEYRCKKCLIHVPEFMELHDLCRVKKLLSLEMLSAFTVAYELWKKFVEQRQNDVGFGTDCSWHTKTVAVVSLMNDTLYLPAIIKSRVEEAAVLLGMWMHFYTRVNIKFRLEDIRWSSTYTLPDIAESDSDYSDYSDYDRYSYYESESYYDYDDDTDYDDSDYDYNY